MFLTLFLLELPSIRRASSAVHVFNVIAAGRGSTIEAATRSIVPSVLPQMLPYFSTCLLTRLRTTIFVRMFRQVLLRSLSGRLRLCVSLPTCTGTEPGLHRTKQLRAIDEAYPSARMGQKLTETGLCSDEW